MDWSFDQFKLKLSDTLKKLGRKNGTSPPPSQDPGDEILHRLYTEKYACSYFDKQRKATEAELLRSFPATQEIVDNMVARAKKKIEGEKAIIFTAKEYCLQLELRKPPEKPSWDKLKAELRRLGWSQEQVDTLITKCTDYGEPAKVYTVNNIR